jgi:4-amino-4-deoxy-L-arabinose transferase-like glycosyltransferase
MAFSHVDYPLLWPFAVAWVWCAVGSFDLFAAKLLAPAVLATIATLAFGIVRRLGGRPDAAIFTAVLLSLPMVLAVTSRLLADAPLCLFVLGCFGCFRLWLESRDDDDLRLSGFFAAGMLLTKNDGIGLFGVLVASAILVAAMHPVEKRARAAAWLGAFPLALASPWLSFRWSLARWNEDYGARFRDSLSVVSPDRALASLGAWLTGFADVADWLVFWPIVLVALVLGWRSLGGRGATFLAAALLLGIGLYVFITILSPWELDALMETAQHRLLVHLAPIGVLLLAELGRAARLMPWSSRNDA